MSLADRGTLRVCHIVSGDLWAGAEVMAYHLLSGLRGMEALGFHAVLLNEGRLARELRALRIGVTVLDETRMSFPGILLRLRGILGEIRPHVIHSHRYKENILAVLASGIDGGAAIVATQHGMPGGSTDERRLKGLLISGMNFALLALRAARVVSVSEDIGRILATRQGFPPGKIVVIRNGIPLPEGGAPRASPEGPFVIGSSGRLFPVKDYPLLIDIARHVLSRADGVRFDLAGDGPEEGRLRRLVAEHGLEERFLLRGFVHDITGFYGGLSLYVTTSRHEGIPMSVLEAMACGLPVVGPRVGGLSEIIRDGVEGYLVEGREAKDFADRCLTLLHDPALRRRMGEAARERIADAFSLGRMAREYRDLYLAVAGR